MAVHRLDDRIREAVAEPPAVSSLFSGASVRTDQLWMMATAEAPGLPVAVKATVLSSPGRR